jgi:DNA transformation protein
MAIDAEALRDLFAAFGPVSVRRMFGGAGVYADGVMFALVSRGTVYLKADAESQPLFAAEGCGPFVYDRAGKQATMTSYWRMPDRLYDDPDTLAQWARRSLAIAQAGRLRG